MFVKHDRYLEARQWIEEFHYPVSGGLPDSGSIGMTIGESRTGKSFTLKRYLRDFPAVVGESGLEMPVVYAEMPVDGGVRGILEELAKSIKLQYSLRMTNPALLEAIKTALVDRNVKLFLIDEIDLVLQEDNKRVLNYTRNLLRRLVDLGTLNVMCVGLEQSYSLLALDKQLTGRGGMPYRHMRAYEWESEEERVLFRRLCDAFDQLLPFNERSGLARSDVAQRLFWVSDGNIGRLKDIIFFAGCAALNDAAERVELSHFAAAYERRKPLRTTYNPFVHDLGQAPKAAPGNRNGGPKGRPPSTASLFAKSRSGGDHILA